MIDKEYGKFFLACDVCGSEVTDFDDFDDALDFKIDNGWKSQKGEALNLKEDWIDVCPDCVEG